MQSRRSPNLDRPPLFRPSFFALLAVIGGLVLSTAVSAVVVPNAHANTSAEGSGNAGPLICGDSPTRLQIVYSGSEVGSGTITEIRFRQDEVSGRGFQPTQFDGVTMTLSSTDAAPDNLSLLLDDNVGSDVVTVLQGSLTVSSETTSADPAPFDIVIPTTTPFSFDASSGKNLLLDVTMAACGPPLQRGTFHDFARVEGDSVSLIHGTPGQAMGFGPSTIGPVTEFGMSGVCVPSDTVLCLSGGRFQVEAEWRTTQGDHGVGHASALSADTGTFWFFGPTNVEMVIKVLDACSFADRFWVFAGGLTNVEVELVVTDTQTDSVVSYTNPISTPFQPIQDTQAFATCP